jgi:hypothetical protein
MTIISLALFILLAPATLASQARTSLLRAGAFALLLAPIVLAAQTKPATGESNPSADPNAQQSGRSSPSSEQAAQQRPPQAGQSDHASAASSSQAGQAAEKPCQCARPGEKPAPRHDSRFDLGLSLNGIAGPAAGASGNTGFGARASYYLVKTERAVAVDAEFSEFLAHSPSTILRGGRATQALFGLKFSAPSEQPYDPKSNVLLKVRPGFISWSDAVTALASGPQGSIVAARHGRSTNLAIDFGMTVDVYLGHEWWSRFDVGDTVVWYQGMTVAGSGAHVSGQTKNNFQLSTGMFYRF